MTSAKKAPPASNPGSSLESSISFSADHLANQFLVAMPGMVDPNFAGTVIYLFEHTERGAMGLVVNRPTELDLGTLFDKIELKLEIAPLLEQPVYFGGPVQVERGFLVALARLEGHVNFVDQEPVFGFTYLFGVFFNISESGKVVQNFLFRARGSV